MAFKSYFDGLMVLGEQDNMLGIVERNGGQHPGGNGKNILLKKLIYSRAENPSNQ